MIYRFSVPDWHPATVNQLLRGKWIAAKKKKIDKNMIAGYAYHAGIPPAHGPRSVKLTITVAKGKRAADVDAYWKSLLDALVNAKLLIDDSRRWCAIKPVEYERGEKRATTIELTDLYT